METMGCNSTVEWPSPKRLVVGSNPTAPAGETAWCCPSPRGAIPLVEAVRKVQIRVRTHGHLSRVQLRRALVVSASRPPPMCL
jgi:hypothetical protein